jgi:ATP phosphoribosyltransferase
MDKPARIKLAVQKSGRLTEPSLDLLARCGLKLARGKDQLMGFGENMPLDVLFVRDDDIPDLVQEDVCDLGLVGRNVLEEKSLALAARGTPARFQALRTLDFGRCRLSLAVPLEYHYAGLPSLQGQRIATTYPYLLGRFLEQHGIAAEIVTLSGAVEIAPRLGRADLICDLVSTGSTLQANHLREVATVLESHAVLIRTPIALAIAKKMSGLSGCCCASRASSRCKRKQVHHAACTARSTACHQTAATGQRVPNDHTARRFT